MNHIPIVTHERILRDLRALGLAPGMHVLAHTSLSRIGHVDGGPQTVVQALIDAVGPEGTVLFPAHTGHPEISPEHPPVFDVRTSQVLNIGIIPETARTMPGAVRSLQPTHSVTAFGRLSSWFTERHAFCSTPCGAGSPYEKLRHVGGYILLLGCDHESNTTLHALEEEAGFVYHMLPGSGVMRITDAEGREHLLPGRFHRWGVERDFMRIDADLTASGIQVIGRIGEAESRLVDAARMWDEITDRLKHDPHGLLPEGYTLPPELEGTEG